MAALHKESQKASVGLESHQSIYTSCQGVVCVCVLTNYELIFSALIQTSVGMKWSSSLNSTVSLSKRPEELCLTSQLWTWGWVKRQRHTGLTSLHWSAVGGAGFHCHCYFWLLSEHLMVFNQMGGATWEWSFKKVLRSFSNLWRPIGFLGSSPSLG